MGAGMFREIIPCFHFSASAQQQHRHRGLPADLQKLFPGHSLCGMGGADGKSNITTRSERSMESSNVDGIVLRNKMVESLTVVGDTQSLYGIEVTEHDAFVGQCID